MLSVSGIEIYCLKCKEFTKTNNIKEELTKSNKLIFKKIDVICV